MISPKVYQQQIQDLKIEGMVVSPENNEEASSILGKLNHVEKILERIRHNIRIDIRTIRMEYIEKIKEINDSSKIIGLYSKPKSMRDKINEKRKLIDDRDMRIAPYESIEYTVDDYLRQINLAKNDITDFLRQQKK